MADAGASAGRAAVVALALGIAGLIVYLSFNAGGFFPDVTGAAAAGLVVFLTVFAAVATAPVAALRPRLGLAVGALGLFGLWQLASAHWSHAPGRAVLEFDRTLLYVLVLVTAGLVADRPSRVRALVYGVVLGIVVVCAAGLLTRTLPGTFPVSPGVANDRLSFPLTYWNALGAMGVVAVVLCVGLTSSGREPRLLRIATAAAVPLLVAAVYLTFSRGSIAAGAAGVLVALLLVPRRHAIPGLLAVVPPAVVVVMVAYGSDALSRSDPTGPAAVADGRRLILVVAGMTVLAGALRALLIRTLEPRLEHLRPVRGRTTAAVAGVAATVLAATALAAAAPARLEHQYTRFVEGTQIVDHGDLRRRLTDPANHGRLEHWRVALDAFASDRLHGSGAGTFQVWWSRLRPEEFSVVNAHSLYIETLGDTGLIGLALLLAALGTMLVGVLLRTRRGDPLRALWAAVAGAMITWLLVAGVDWIWQMPAATVGVLALGAAALARPAAANGERDADRRSDTPATLRLIAGVALLLVAVTPIRVAVSQARLTDSVDALRHGDCRASVRAALASADALGARAEPYELLAYCDARLGLGRLAETMADRAIARDPLNWEYHYDLAIARGVQGLDPRPALAEAQRLNPLSSDVFNFRHDVAHGGPRTWRKRAAAAHLLLPEELGRKATGGSRR